MEYFIPIQFATLVDLIDRINEIAVDIQSDIMQYNLLSTSLERKDAKKLIYHHLIKGLCSSAVKRNLNETFFVYSDHRLSFTKLNSLFNNTAAEMKQILEEFIKVCKSTIGLQIIQYSGGAKKLFDDYQSGCSSAISPLCAHKTSVKNNKKSQLTFFHNYGLRNLYEEHFKNVNYLILTT